MSLQSGTRLGPYEIVSLIGEGGMGEVYKAKDSRLNRSVAIKVLHRQVAQDPELRQRFDREAQVIAALSHPNICTLHDVGDQDGMLHLVMEYVDGETLASRLSRGPVKMEQALEYAIQIAEAMAVAHRHGVVHRDLKPGNIMVTKSGIKLLDFGLAKFKQAESPGVVNGMSSLPTNAAITGSGTILGTLQYMSPEQLEGKETDARTDIFAFGALLYEMLTGRKAFEGPSQATVIAAIVHVDPPALRDQLPSIPAGFERIIKRCLAKHPDDRWQSARDLAAELRWISEPAGEQVRTVVQQKTRPAALAWSIAAVGILATLILWIAPSFRTESTPSIMRLTLPIADAWDGALSPDGKHVVYSSSQQGFELYVRGLDSGTNRSLGGIKEATSMAWSPDGESVAFGSQRKLMSIRLQGGEVQTLCEMPVSDSARGIAWSGSDIVLFSVGEGPLYQVPASGGKPVPLTTLNSSREETAHLWPQFLPDSRHFIFFIQSRNAEHAGIYVSSLDSKEPRLVLKTNVKARFAPPGYLLFVRDTTLMAQPFDLKTMTLTGRPTSLADGVGTFPAYGGSNFSTSDTGVVIYASDLYLFKERELLWLNRLGTLLGSLGKAAPSFIVNLSPDETRLATTRLNDGNANTWIIDLARNIATPLDNERSGEFDPQWSPDGARIAFSSDRKGAMALFMKSLSGGSAELLQESSAAIFMNDWSSDGRHVAYHQEATKLFALPLFGDRKPILILDTPFRKDQVQFAPNTQWVAYNANNSGRDEVYVVSFPKAGQEIQVSRDGGVQPRWRGDGRELFFLDPKGQLMSVDVKTEGARIEFGNPKALFQTRVEPTPEIELYDVTRDGQRFIMLVPATDGSPMNVIVNWPSALAK